MSTQYKQLFTVKVIATDEGFIGKCLELPGAISEGNTLEELKKNMTEAIKLILEEINESSKNDYKMIIEVIREDKFPITQEDELMERVKA
ncbi:MAG TPA: type II toxin-antitoxin system HicB family antitoxin [Candidatus Nitrosotenuis sp.]